MDLQVVRSLEALDASAWDGLISQDDPFSEHAFLSLLEQSGSVGSEASGWFPMHLTVYDGQHLAGALPLYLKDHSFGEFIFDWSWAGAASQLGEHYYPKLVSMVPFTPVTGRRFLVHPDADRQPVVAKLVEGALDLARQYGASSWHVLFTDEHDQASLEPHRMLMPRASLQFHWHNRDYRDFEHFLSSFRSALRKQVRKERRKAAESGLDVRVIPGAQATEAHWKAMYRFYIDTCQRKGSPPYLTRAFFDQGRQRLQERALFAMAFDRDEPVAGSLSFEKGSGLFGRYWGCLRDFDSLHFELCLYRLIDRAIMTNKARFEAGAQGAHKLRRGLEPTQIHSHHWIGPHRLRAAVADFLPREREHVMRQMQDLAPHGPFRRE